jgi:hypothetical protein
MQNTGESKLQDLLHLVMVALDILPHQVTTQPSTQKPSTQNFASDTTWQEQWQEDEVLPQRTAVTPQVTLFSHLLRIAAIAAS